MKTCPKCGKKWETGKFCEDCGVPLQEDELQCAKCGTKLNSNAKFCPECGAKVEVENGSTASILDTLGYDGIKVCPICKTKFSALKNNCPKCDMQCGETTIDNSLYENAEKQGDIEAANYLSRFAEKQAEKNKSYEYEPGEEDHEVAFDLMYSDDADEADFPRAFELFKESADKGYGESYFWLARCYDGGLGCDKDDRQAVYWYKKAVEYDDDPYAAADLGERYFLGEGITEDKNKAYQLFKKAAAKNVAKGQFWLGWCSINGEGCEENPNRAYQNFHLAAKNGYGNTAKLWLARCYERGLGTNQNPTRAYQLYQELADEDDEWGLYHAGCCIASGFGTQQNLNRGLEMIRQAAELGCKEAQELLKNRRNESIDAFMTGATFGLWHLGKKILGK